MTTGSHYKIPLQVVLVTPFVVLLFCTSAFVGYLSYRNGQRAVNEVAHDLREEITLRIVQHLRTFLSVPEEINQLNVDSLCLKVGTAGDPDALMQCFWEQVRVFETVTSIYFGNSQGGLVNAGREGMGGPLYVILTDGFTSGPFRKYSVDEQGAPAELMVTVPDFDARSRPWFTSAVEKGGPVWSEPYVLFTGQDMAIAASRPVYTAQGDLLGVVSVDIFVSHLSDFLNSIEIGKSGQAFVLDQTGRLVTTSTGEKPFTSTTPASQDGAPLYQRLNAIDSANPITRQTAAALLENFGDFSKVAETRHFEFCAQNGATRCGNQFVQVTPVHYEGGLDWLVVVVIPEADFMEQIQANNRVTALLVAGALLAALALGLQIANQVTHPVKRLNASAQALARGEWLPGEKKVDSGEGPIEVDCPVSHPGAEWIREIAELSVSFDDMATRLNQSMDNLVAEIAERQLTENALRESRKRFELAIQGADLGTWDWNVRTGEEVFNRRWAEMLGYTLEEIIFDHTSWESRIHPEDTPRVLGALNAHLEGQTPVYQVEQRLRTKSGEWKWVLTTGKVFERDQQGRALRAVGTHRDIDERKRAEQALQESHRQLEAALLELQQAQASLVRQERLAAIGQMAAGIAHDFNNLLTAVALYTQMSLNVENLSPTMRQRLEVIASQADRATDLVQQILDFSRKAVIVPQPLAIDVLLGEVFELLRSSLPGNILLELEMDAELPGMRYRISADSTRVQQVIMNLALNARDAMPGGGRLRFSLSRLEGCEFNCKECGRIAGGSWVEMRVADTGAGIDPQVLPHIFEPFYTTKSPKGSGLGLGQVYGIVKQHGGHLDVETQPGQGTIFRLYWPALQEAAGGQESGTPDSLLDGVALQQDGDGSQDVQKVGEPVPILVAADYDLMREALVDALDATGYRAVQASSGLEALRLLDEQRAASDIRLVVCDLSAPEMSGIAFAQAIGERRQDIRIVMLTERPVIEIELDGWPANIVEWLHKPLDLQTLAQAIQKALE